MAITEYDFKVGCLYCQFLCMFVCVCVGVLPENVLSPNLYWGQGDTRIYSTSVPYLLKETLRPPEFSLDRKQVLMLNTGSGQWACVKTCSCFVHGQAAQECTLCTPVGIDYFLSSLYVLCRKWFFNTVHANSISCHKMWHICFHSLLILLVTFDMSSHRWGKRWIHIW